MALGGDEIRVRLHAGVGVGIVLWAVLLLGAGSAAAATTWTVNTAADTNTSVTDECSPGGPANACSLRRAIETAAPGDTVSLPGGPFVYSVAYGPMAILHDVTIAGTGSPTIDAHQLSRVFTVTGAPNVTISGVEITHGHSIGGSGGGASAIETDGGALTLSGDTFTGDVNYSPGQGGNGTIEVNATAATALNLVNTTFAGEQSGGNGSSGDAIVYVATTSGSLTTTVTGSTFHANMIGGGGGGGDAPLTLSPAGASSTTIDSSTFDHNSVGGGGSNPLNNGIGYGGAVTIFGPPDVGTVAVTASRFTDNTVGGIGTAVANSGEGMGGALDIQSAGDVSVSGSTFARNVVGGTGSTGENSGSGFGGGISMMNSGNLTVANSVFEGNHVGGAGGGSGSPNSDGKNSGSGYGGGISTEGSGDVTVTGSTFDGNVVGGNGGAGTNSGAAYGGAISDEGSGTAAGGATITNGTITGNTIGGTSGAGTNSGAGFGGAIDGELGAGKILLTNDTIDANTVLSGTGASGGGVYAAGNPFTARNTILTANTVAGAVTNCDAAVTLSDHNVEHGSASCGFHDAGSSGADPLLGALADNGGPTHTQQLQLAPAASPAIDLGDPAACPLTDQRGASRPDDPGTACDVGAVESGASPPGQGLLTVSLAGTGTGSVSGSGISCPGTCSHIYPAGASVTLAATAAAGSMFAGWSGACTGTGACTLTMTAARVVTATFKSTGLPPVPILSSVHLTHPKFRVAKGATAIQASTKAPLGTTFRFTLSAVAQVRIVFTRSAPGVRRSKRCVAPTRKLKRAHAKRCARTLVLGTLTRTSEPKGTDKVAFTGRIGHRALPPGHYSASLTASDASGHSRPVTLTFTVVP